MKKCLKRERDAQERSPVLGNSFNSLVVLFLDSTLFSYVKGRVGSPASGGTLFQDEAVLWCEERSDTMAYSMTTEYNSIQYNDLNDLVCRHEMVAVRIQNTVVQTCLRAYLDDCLYDVDEQDNK